MWRRLCAQRVVVVRAQLQQRAGAPRRGLLLRHTGAVLSTGRTGQQGRRGETGVEGESAERLAGEVTATRNESQLMAEEMQQAGSARLPAAAANDWTEPALEDLDRSIPQVDCAFIADLIRARTARRKEFLQAKERVRAKVAALSKRQASSVVEAARFPVLGAGRGGSGSSSDGLTAGDDGEQQQQQQQIAASPEVVAQLTEEERDALLSSRPEYDDGFVLLDCRTVNEVTSWGMIEGAKLLPAHEMFDGFHLTPEEFEVEFGFAKPRPEQKVICYCQYGPRSLMAAQILSWMGYMNVLHFRDGYYEWGKQYNLLLRRWMLHDKESGNEVRRQVAFQAGLELQREIAPEFNALPRQEADRYRLDTTRSRGRLLVGAGVREAACRQVAALVAGMQPPLLPGVLDDADRAAATPDGGAVGKRERHLQRFLRQTTGMDAREDTRPAMGVAEAQQKVMDAFTRRDGGSHPQHR
ncbi:Rhodanese-like protein [Trypanosoma conorhini]|uniref:Rhodanese-like protein n=1 Tax=Trypanosoma conorhini TaxID=83891 RepID=A0A3R7MKT5_9TRYP|nr:Rhodanese-like protein [Trypanosoma conorhini]RNF07664.1 Rhodanese-like protein [Trypanosoma conorhini]